jgi:uncharacterized small protein (DUF1192 family)
LHTYKIASVTSFGAGDVVGLRDSQVDDRKPHLELIETIGAVSGPEKTTNGKPIEQKVGLYKVIGIIHLKGGETLYSKTESKSDAEGYLRLEIEELKEEVATLKEGAVQDREAIKAKAMEVLSVAKLKDDEIAKLKSEIEKLKKPGKK